MLSFFRRVSKSKIGTWIMALVVIAIMGGFALADLSNFGTGNLGFGMGSSTLAQVGNQQVGDREMRDAMQRRLQQVREQNPEADYATIAGDFDQILDSLLDERALIAFADKFGFHLSKRLVDAEIAQIPATKGLNGRFNQQAYLAFLAQQRLTDAQVREIISGSLLQRLLFTPVRAIPRVPVSLARPYADMLLEARQGDVAAIPFDAFKAGLSPTDADLQRYYAANGKRYMVPEQRVIRIARIGPEQVANVTASEQEIAAYYNSNKASYASKETRTLSQAVAQDQRTAAAIATKAKAGGTLQAAASGTSAPVTSVGEQTQGGYAGIAGAKAAAAVFSAPSDSVVGPIQSEFGWVVVKVESTKTQGGKTLEQARSEIATKLTADKRKAAIEDLVDKVQTAVDDGANFAETAGQAKLPVTSTPLIIANGTSRTDTSYKTQPELAPALKTGFEIAPNDPSEVVTLPNGQGYALVSPAQVVPAAPAPLASIRQQVANDWINSQATERARAAAQAIAAKTARGVSLADAVKQSGAAIPPAQPLSARRIQIAMATGQVPPALQLLFTLTQGKSRMVADAQRRAFYVVKVNKIMPGNALLQPALIAQMQNELQQAIGADYESQFMAAIRAEMKAKRNDAAIQAEKRQITSTAS
jgi:peptidyl-prolyl cis-trans isomerase D